MSRSGGKQNGPETALARCPEPDQDEGYFVMATGPYRRNLPFLNEATIATHPSQVRA